MKKKYNPDTKLWENYTPPTDNLKPIRDKLNAQKIHFIETTEGIFTDHINPPVEN